MSATKEFNLPVLIVGGGPVGLALAVELGVRGIKCMLVEQGDGSILVPKMSQLTTRTMEFCRRWGIVEKVKKAGWPENHPGDFVYLTSMVGHELYRRKTPSYTELGELSYTPEGPRQCPQIFFDPILLQHAASLPTVSLRHRTHFDSYATDSEGIHARLTDLESGRVETVDSSYLVGCDGFDSPVRKALGIDFPGSGVLSFSVSIFFRSRELATLHDKGWARFYRPVDSTGHWGDLIAIDGRELWRLTVLDLDPDTDMDTFDVDGCLRRAVGIAFPYEIISVLPWKRRDLIADCYGQGRVFIAGDSAHQCSPTGGIGMNTGIGDAVDIGWKLATVLDGWGGKGLLESYEAERRPVAVSHVNRSTELYRQLTGYSGGAAIDDDTPEGERTRRQFVTEYLQSEGKTETVNENVKLGYCYEDSPIISPDGSKLQTDPSGVFIPSARPGTRAPHAWIGRGRSTLDLFGNGFVLLRFGKNPVTVSGLVDAATASGVPFQVVDINNPKIADLYERKLVLVRPDGHVAWRGDTCPNHPRTLMELVCGQRSR